MKRMMTALCLSAFLLLLAACGKKEAPAETTQAAAPAGAFAGLANPWTDTDYDGFKEMTGLDLLVPEGAKEVIFRVLKEENLGEMRFTLSGLSYTARIKPCAAFEDISGLYYTFEKEEDCKVGWCEGKIKEAKDGKDTVKVCLWCDMAPGIMYSLSVQGPDLAGADLPAVAALVYKPMQGDVG